MEPTKNKSRSSKRPEHISGGYSTIPWQVQDSNSFKGASDKARSLLFALMRQHNGSNNGHLQLAKKWLYKQGWICDANNLKARNELIERGLVTQTKWGGLHSGVNLYALTWHVISNYVGLEIDAKGYNKGAWALCVLPPTKRRSPPVRKQIVQLDDCANASPTTVQLRTIISTTIELKNAQLGTQTVTSSENNVFIPLPRTKSARLVRRIVGLKGRSGVLKLNNITIASELSHAENSLA